jgi:hypothetical protein
MTTLKTSILAIALLAGGTTLAMAQAQGSSGPDGQLKDGAADNPPARSPASGRTARHHGAKHHRVYMMSVNRTHKGSKLTPASNAKLQMKQ